MATLTEFIENAARELRKHQISKPALEYVLRKRLVTLSGLWLEFGVFKGRTINLIARHTSQIVYGFDSFHGLPEDWRKGKLKGRFSTNGLLPTVASNVVLVQGWFDKTLPLFLEQHTEPAALIHIDCDIYSSTKTVLAQLTSRIVSGTVIVFDELFNYPGFECHEIKALFEYLQETGKSFRWIGTQGEICTSPDADFEREYYSRYRGTALIML